MEITKKTGTKKYKLKNYANCSVSLPKETTYDELRNIVSSQYKISRKCETYLDSYSEKNFLQYLNVHHIKLRKSQCKCICVILSRTTSLFVLS